MHRFLLRSSLSLLLLAVAAALLIGCQEAPPGDLRAVGGQGSYFGSPDTVKARLLGWELPLGALQFEELDSAEAAWLEARGYVLVDWRIDSTATYYYRRQADRRSRWDQHTLMTERLYVRQDSPTKRLGHTDAKEGADAGEEGPWSIVVGTMSDSASARRLLKQYQMQFATTSLPVRVSPVAAGDTTLYRVLVGTFDSLAVRRAINRYGPKLPPDAWPVRRP